MEDGQRRALAVLWLVVALLIATTLGSVEVASIGGAARIAIIVLSLSLSAMYVFDPRGIVTERPF